MADRLPVVGPLDGGNQPGLWICAGMGSRGLSFSVLCAELLAARMGAEPLPLESQLAKALEALRA
jgi:tRNA 5-methylaminomethyl-2-thiouridine biosynthesis bifunctional protein